MSEWKRNRGSKTPPCEGLVEVKLRNGNTFERDAAFFDWTVDGYGGDIMKWRKVEDISAETENPSISEKQTSDDSAEKALDVQVGGGHYKDMNIQPVEYIYKNGIGYFEGCVIKYVSRWQKKGGVEDLKKARHFLDLLIEFQGE